MGTMGRADDRNSFGIVALSLGLAFQADGLAAKGVLDSPGHRALDAVLDWLGITSCPDRSTRCTRAMAKRFLGDGRRSQFIRFARHVECFLVITAVLRVRTNQFRHLSPSRPGHLCRIAVLCDCRPLDLGDDYAEGPALVVHWVASFFHDGIVAMANPILDGR